MDNKYFLPLAIAGLTIGFTAVSVLVYITRGNPALVRKKLRLGALLHTLTGAATGCSDGVATCYAPLPGETILLESTPTTGEQGELILNLSQTDTLAGRVEYRTGATFSFTLASQQDSVLQKENILARDGAFDEPTEPFTIAIRQDLAAGRYFLNLYNVPLDSIGTRTPRNQYNLQIVR